MYTCKTVAEQECFSNVFVRLQFISVCGCVCVIVIPAHYRNWQRLVYDSICECDVILEL